MEEQLSGEEEERRRNRQKRLEEMRISKQKQMMRRMYMKKAAPFVLGAFIIFIIILGGKSFLPNLMERSRQQIRFWQQGSRKKRLILAKNLKTAGHFPWSRF